MSLFKYLFKEYVEDDWGVGFKGLEYFKFVISKSGVKWIESQISEHLINSDILTSERNLSLYTHGSQYIVMYYNDKKMIMRMSTHKENRNDGENSHYAINMWNTNEREIKDHINSFIDYCIVYFNGLEKMSMGNKLTNKEREIINTINKNELFHEPTTYPSLTIVHRKAIKKKMNGTKPNIIHLP